MAMESLLVLAVMTAAQRPDTEKNKLNFSGVQAAAAHFVFEASPLQSSQEIPHMHYIDSLKTSRYSSGTLIECFCGITDICLNLNPLDFPKMILVKMTKLTIFKAGHEERSP